MRTGLLEGEGRITPASGSLENQAEEKFGSYAGYVASLVDGTVFGRSVHGVTRGFLGKLKKAEAAAAAAIGGAAPDFGVRSIGGYRAGAGMHNWGLAIDID